MMYSESGRATGAVSCSWLCPRGTVSDLDAFGDFVVNDHASLPLQSLFCCHADLQDRLPLDENVYKA
jgi:hypothetical protein